MKTWLVWLYLTTSVGMVGTFSYGMMRGWEMGSPDRKALPREVRSRPGGYRGFHFWYVGYGGYRGGK